MENEKKLSRDVNEYRVKAERIPEWIRNLNVSCSEIQSSINSFICNSCIYTTCLLRREEIQFFKF